MQGGPSVYLPPMPPPRPARLLALAGCLVAGCAVSSDAVRPPASVRPDPVATSALRDSLVQAPSAAARRGVAVRALRTAGVTPLAGGLFTRGVTAPLVGGFVPGAVPSKASELVVLGASLEGPGAADVVDAARVLVDLSLAQTVPERTVQVVFWSAPLSPREGVEAALRSPLWPRDAVRTAVVLASGAALPDSVGGADVRAVEVGGTDTVSRLVAAVLTAAAEPALPPPAP